jgi:hypothetical protein
MLKSEAFDLLNDAAFRPMVAVKKGRDYKKAQVKLSYATAIRTQMQHPRKFGKFGYEA